MLMPTDGVQLMHGDENAPLTGYRSAFKKESEKAKPGYYRVMLDDHGIQAELTATTRCGFHKYTFPSSADATIILDLVHGIEDKVTGSEIALHENNGISGYRRSMGWAKDQIVFFYAEFSSSFVESGIADASGKILEGNKHENSEGLKAFMKFKVRNYDAVFVKVGISTVSVENAKANLRKEIPSWDFAKTIKDADNAWEDELGRIVVEDGTRTEKINFYTALYHTMISPNIMSDTDGRYRGMDGKIHKMDRGNMYTVFSLWDTFRALHPLFTIIDPVRAQEFVRALLQKYKESGLLPVWELASNETGCMIGYHSVPVIADAYMKGLRDFDTELAYEAVVKSAMMDQLGLKYYKNQGYIPADKENESVSKTLEYAYDDWCIAQMAAGLKKTADYEYFTRRSKTYLNVYDKESGFMRGKKNANWMKPFDPYEVSGIYTEANAWQYTWFVPHNVEGSIKMMGGRELFKSRLDTLFGTKAELTGRTQPDISGMIGQYAHGNEPSHHMAYLYNFTSTPYRTAELTRKIMREFYSNERDGLSGNEDCGQMSAWYVFSSMGFYPVCPGNNIYEFGSPLFDKITIGKGTGNKFVIISDSLSPSNIYIQEAKLNDKVMVTKLTHSDIGNGGVLHFAMSSTQSAPDVTFSETADSTGIVMIPFLESGEKAFYDSCYVAMHCNTAGAEIKFTTDGTEPGHNSKKYSKPFYITESTNFKIKALRPGMEESFIEEATFIKLPYRKTIIYKQPFSHLYTAGGTNGLVDGIHGEPNAFGAWQGFYGDDFEVVIDLGEIRSFKKIETTFLQQYPSWIWLPAEVEYSISDDNSSFTRVYNHQNIVPLNQPDSFIKAFTFTYEETHARYVKVTAKNIKTCPPWHPGSGEKAWIFVDEIKIE